jgi:putative ABC transport system permease protein
MLRNYFITTLRTIQRNPVYFLINLIGLSVGILCCMMILLFVKFEFSFDQFHSKRDRLYRVNYNTTIDGNQTISPSVPVFVAPHLKRMFPEIEDATRVLLSFNPITIGSEDGKTFEETNFIWADSTFFKLLDFRQVSGNLITALNRPNTLVISESTAKKYFGDLDPLGKTLLYDNKTPYEIAAVIENVPDNSHFSFDLVTSIYSRAGIDDETVIWNSPNYGTYVLLKPHTDIGALQSKINKWSQESSGTNLDLEALAKVHFNTQVSNFQNRIAVTDVRYLYIFIAIAGLVLAIACINYINLATARATLRAKEVGIRKTSGANSYQLTFQYLGESFFVLLPSVFVATILMLVLMPSLSSFIGRKIETNVWSVDFIGVVLIGWVVLSFLAGFYPALILSRFKPAAVLKGKLRVGSTALRKGLVIIQFSISTMLIVGTLVVFSQLKFMQTHNLGMDKESILFIRGNNDLKPSLQSLIQKLKSIPGVTAVAGTSRSPFNIVVGYGFQLSPNPENAELKLVGAIGADQEYLNAMGMELIKGRNFDPTRIKDTINEFIVNEAFLRDFDLTAEEALGKQVTLGIVRDHGPGTIIGIVKDFHFSSLHETIKPAVLFNSSDWISGMIVRLSAGNPQSALQQIEKDWKTFVPQRPFNFMFLDDQYDGLYRTEQRLGKLALIFSSVAVVVACLGLLGLAAFTSVQRTKEISVRKVLGATTTSIILLLSNGYLRLLIISFSLAAPVSYFLLNKWLENFAFKVTIGPVYFLIALTILLTVAWLTVGYQSYKASSANPASNLRLE